MKNVIKKIAVFVVILACSCSPSPFTPRLQTLSSPVPSLLQAVSIFNDQTVWISGHNGTILRTKDGGENWQVFKHPTGDTLQFRDIHGVSGVKAIVMSAGPGPLSRIFTFTEPLWQENFIMKDSLGFLDCMDFWDENRGIAYGDSFDGYPYILLTKDGGKTWNRIEKTRLFAAGQREGGFAASGTCVETAPGGEAWIATGAGGNGRLLLTDDYGKTWSESPSPIVKGEVAGHTSVSFINHVGFVTGGDLFISDRYTDNCAFSQDNGKTWRLTARPQKTKGAFYGGALSKVGTHYFAFACGPNGMEYTHDLGKTWIHLDDQNYWAVAMQGTTGYATGKEGKILKITLQRL